MNLTEIISDDEAGDDMKDNHIKKLKFPAKDIKKEKVVYYIHI